MVELELRFADEQLQAGADVIGVGDAAAEEVILKLDTPFSHAAENGTVLEFEGTFEAFTKAPYCLTIMASQEKIDGWPAKHK